MTIKNKRFKYLIITILILIPLIFILKLGNEIGGTMYDGTEFYEFDITKKELVSAIMKFREQNPSLKPPQEYPMFFNAKYDINDVYSSIYFYYPNEKFIVKTFVGGLNNEKKSELGLFCIIDLNAKSPDDFKGINKNLGCTENRRLLQMFEDRIVNPLRKQIEADKKKKQ